MVLENETVLVSVGVGVDEQVGDIVFVGVLV
jgi:hypothetical protein